MISLIINADDLGASSERDRGILEAFTEGLVTSASILANGASFATAATAAREIGLPVGVHLNLSEGQSLTGRIAGLTDPDGHYPGKTGLRQCLAGGHCDLEALRRECRAQIEKIFSSGLVPDHLDSHQHCHLFPCLAELILELAGEYQVNAVRNSRPAEPASADPAGSLGDELALYRMLNTEQPSPDLTGAKILRPEGLWGMPLLGRLDTAALCDLLMIIPDGTWELMTHPGYPGGAGAFSGPERQTELVALTSHEARGIIAERGIRLISFGDLSCVS